MRVIRYLGDGGTARLAAVPENAQAYSLPYGDVLELASAAEGAGIAAAELAARHAVPERLVAENWTSLPLLAPVEAPEVWAAGVTYLRSREARNYEATGGRMDATTFYDKVYDAPRPELFFKSTAARTVGPGGDMSLRSDSNWQVPEPELGLVLDRTGRIIGYTAGNDLSCRDIEGENPLYLPQAKMWRRSCSIGPAIRLAETVDNPYAFDMVCRIYRDGEEVVSGSASTGQLKRKLDELVYYLRLDNELFDGTVLLTGTCIVPPNEFTLRDGDRIEIDIGGIGTLINHVHANSNL